MVVHGGAIALQGQRLWQGSRGAPHGAPAALTLSSCEENQFTPCKDDNDCVCDCGIENGWIQGHFWRPPRPGVRFYRNHFGLLCDRQPLAMPAASVSPSSSELQQQM